MGGRLYFGLAPEDATFPFLTLNVIDNVPNYTFTTTAERMRVQFSAFTDDDFDGNDCEAIVSALRERFERQLLTFTGSDYAGMDMMPELAVGPRIVDAERGRAQHTLDFVLMAQEL